MTLSGIAAIAALLGLGITGVHGAGSIAQRSNIKDAYNYYTQLKNDAGLQDIDTKDIISRLKTDGKLTESEYKRALNIIDTLEDDMTGTDFKNALHNFFSSHPTNKQDLALYEKLASEIPYISKNYVGLEDLPERLKKVFYGSIPKVGGIGAPTYLDTEFTGEGDDMQVDPVKLWTGQELADLHNINYDVNHYYDLIKQGTEANVNLGDYTNRQALNASMINDTSNLNSYLDTLRNAKAESIAQGATAGARAASELLGTSKAINNYSNNQAQVANDRYETIDPYLQENSNAALNARNYFTNTLAKSLSQDSALLYSNDTSRFGQEQLTRSELRKADAELAGARAAANAQMYGDYVATNAYANSVQRSLNNTADTFYTVYRNMFDKNNGSIPKTNSEFENYLSRQYTGYNTIYDYILSNTNK